MLQNLTETFGTYAPSWSITNEMLYYIFYGILVYIALKIGIRATTLGMFICVGVALVMEVAHFRLFHSPFTQGLGSLFGLGAIWFLGALVAENRPALARSRLARVGSSCWPLILLLGMGLWFSRRVHIQVLFLVLAAAFSLMLVRFIAVDGVRSPDPGPATRVGCEDERNPRSIELPDLPVSWSVSHADLFRDFSLGSHHGLADHLGHPVSGGYVIRSGIRLLARAADLGMEEIIPATVRDAELYRDRRVERGSESPVRKIDDWPWRSDHDDRRVLHQLRTLPSGPSAATRRSAGRAR